MSEPKRRRDRVLIDGEVVPPPEREPIFLDNPETPLYDGPEDIHDLGHEDIIQCYLVINGSLNMNAGKIAGQAFHVGFYLGQEKYASHAYGFTQHSEIVIGWQTPSVNDWIKQGRRIVVRLAETAHTFKRVCIECEGIIQRDEGMTEVDHGAHTAFITRPYYRSKSPNILQHKKVQLL